MKLKSWSMVIGLMLLVGCSAGQVQKEQAVIVKLKADAHTVIVTGCAGLPAAEVILATVLEVIPAGTTQAAIQQGLLTYGPQAAALCAKVTAPAVAPAS